MVCDHDLPSQVTEWEESICAENPHKFGTEKDVSIPTAAKSDF
jgi:hypothetical protein